MPRHPQWSQPSMFPPEAFPLPSVTIDLAVHLDGVRDRVEVWVTIRDPASIGAISIEMMPRAPLVDATTYAPQVLTAAIEEALRHLLPF